MDVEIFDELQELIKVEGYVTLVGLDDFPMGKRSINVRAISDAYDESLLSDKKRLAYLAIVFSIKGLDNSKGDLLRELYMVRKYVCNVLFKHGYTFGLCNAEYDEDGIFEGLSQQIFKKYDLIKEEYSLLENIIFSSDLKNKGD
jgi:hypothetical protein